MKFIDRFIFFHFIRPISLLDKRVEFLFRVIDVSCKPRSKVSMLRRIIFITISIALLKIDRRTDFMVSATSLTIPSLYTIIAPSFSKHSSKIDFQKSMNL